MKPSEAFALALGYARGQDAQREEHGSGCCCKNCPWGGNHGWPELRTVEGPEGFAMAFAANHAHLRAPEKILDSAYDIWQSSGGKRIG